MAIELSDVIRCPRCRSRLNKLDHRLYCYKTSCRYAADGFEQAGNQPVLIDFEQSIFDQPRSGDPILSVLPRDEMRTSLRNRVMDFFHGHNPTSGVNSRAMLSAMKAFSPSPSLLIIGGGSRGAGVETFLQDDSVQVIATDVYGSANTALVTDAHQLPFEDAVFDGVWITAVLEHVLEPKSVVDEIWRVLKPEGLVYAETPFMAPVHEKAYDFTRFTASGHRWLFRGFEQMAAGVGRDSGAGMALAASLRYFVRALLSERIATLVALPLFGLRFFDRFAHARPTADAAAGFYFLGRKSRETLSPKDMVGYYESQIGWRHRI
jgi:SAM-dependent methyltransferase